MKKIFVILLMSFIHSCGNKILYTYKSENYSEDMKYEIADINEVFKYPNRYNEKNISIRGFFRFGFEIGGIYKSKRSASTHDGSNAIWLGFGDSLSDNVYSSLLNFDRRNAIIKGQYFKGLKGHLGAFNGEIKVHYLEIK